MKLDAAQRDRLLQLTSNSVAELRNIPWPEDLKELLPFYLIKYTGVERQKPDEFEQLSFLDDGDIFSENEKYE